MVCPVAHELAAVPSWVVSSEDGLADAVLFCLSSFAVAPAVTDTGLLD